MNPVTAQTDVSKGVLKAISQARSNLKARTVNEALDSFDGIVDRPNPIVQPLPNNSQSKWIAVRCIEQGAATPSLTKCVSRSTRSVF